MITDITVVIVHTKELVSKSVMSVVNLQLIKPRTVQIDRERGRGSAKGRLQNFRRDNRQFQKRRNNDYPKEHGSKRARFNNRRGRSNYKNVAKNSNQPKQQQATNTKSGDSKMNK
ncbi:GSCOCG00011738001-RA-CDS, partial [Cotesia congregata]